MEKQGMEQQCKEQQHEEQHNVSSSAISSRIWSSKARSSRKAVIFVNMGLQRRHLKLFVENLKQKLVSYFSNYNTKNSVI